MQTPDFKSYLDEPDAQYLHLEAARARRAVLRARMKLANRELSEQFWRIRLHRLKIQHFKRELEGVDTTVGQWCDALRRSGRSLYSPTMPHRVSRFTTSRKSTLPCINRYIYSNMYSRLGSRIGYPYPL